MFGEPDLIEQGMTRKYNIKITGEIPETGIQLVWYLDKPNALKTKASFDNLNEHIIYRSVDYLKTNALYYKDGEDMKEVNFDQMHWFIMEILAGALTDMKEKGEGLFYVDARYSSWDYDKLIKKERQRVDKLKKELQEIEIETMELEKKKILEDFKRKTLWGADMAPQQTAKKVDAPKVSPIKSTLNKDDPLGIKNMWNLLQT